MVWGSQIPRVSFSTTPTPPPPPPAPNLPAPPPRSPFALWVPRTLLPLVSQCQVSVQSKWMVGLRGVPSEVWRWCGQRLCVQNAWRYSGDCVCFGVAFAFTFLKSVICFWKSWRIATRSYHIQFSTGRVILKTKKSLKNSRKLRTEAGMGVLITNHTSNFPSIHGHAYSNNDFTKITPKSGFFQ